MKHSKLNIIISILMIMSFVLASCTPAPVPAPAQKPAEQKPAEQKPVEQKPAEQKPAEQKPAEQKPAEQKPADKLKVAILLPGSATDQSWNQLGYEAIQDVKKELGAEIAYSENVGNTDSPDALRDYASKGYQVIFGHGGQYEEAMLKVGPEFPKTTFIAIAGSKGGGTNVVAADTAPWQYGYAYGWMAGKMTKSNKVGYVTALEGMQTMNNLVGGWKKGVKAANPKATACVVYLKDMNDVAAAKEAATAMIADGADVIEHELNAASQGVIDVAKEKKVWTIGRNFDQVKGAPDAVMTIALFSWGPKFVNLVKEAVAGKLKPGFFAFGYHTEAPGFTYAYDDKNAWNPAIPKDLIALQDKEVGDMFRKDPNMSFTVEDAKGGCEGGSVPKSDKPLKVAILLPGSATDQSWNQLGYEAIQDVKKELGAEIAYSENVGNTDSPDALRDYASKGYQVIFGHGGQYEEAMLKVGPEFPDTTFIAIAGSKGGGTNVVAADTAPWQYGYAYGWMAGKMTKSNKVGYVTALEGMQTMNNLVGGWKKGVKAANPKATACVVYLKDMNDVAAAKEAATAMIADGADVIEHELNAASQGVIDVAKEKKVWTIGRNFDQVKGAPDAVMTIALFSWGPKFVNLVKEAVAGKLKPGFFAFGYHTEAPGFTYAYDDKNAWNPAIPKDLIALQDKEVGDMFRKDPMMSFTVEDAKGGCQ